ncbi:MAG: M66 family metalloprotease [Gemmatimonadetes bacterium]|nr:M66 family metalloprotease [Gemmatimonadota bacterium]
MQRRVSRSWGTALLILVATCSEAPEPTAPPVTPVDADHPDRQTLIALYNATGGPGWWEDRNWNGAMSIGTWHGVETNSDGFVTELSLAENNLTGTLPAQLGDLVHLKRLVLDNNELTGRIPPDLGDLSELTMLDLSWNALAGSIPSELGMLARLDTLDLFSNELSGTIPPSLADLGALRRFTVGWNQLSGPIPGGLGNLAHVTYMNFSRNELTGTVPPQLGNLGAVEVLSVSRNNLTGTIPVELGNLSSVEGLYLYDNQLTGEIPPELGRLSTLETLWIHQNDLTGPIPQEFGNLAALQVLRAYENDLSGEIPSGLAGLPLTILWLHDNALSGRLPVETGEIGTLEHLTLHGNPGLSGLLPRSLLDLEYLSTLTFADTGLCEQVDEEFQEWLRGVRNTATTECDIGQVERLALAEFHALTGGTSWGNRAVWVTDAAVGDWYGVTTESGRVVELSLADNGLVGPLPPELANLAGLKVVDLSGNDLSGAFPAAVAGLSELTELRVGGNMGLEGALPFAMRRLERLRVLAYEGTGLCASPSANFQAWFAAITETAGAICDNPDQVTVSLPIVYLTQSVQTPSRRVRLVANRDALLRAFVTAEEPRGFFEPEVVAVFTGPGGDEAHRVVMTRDDNQIPAEAEEGDLKLSYNAVIPAGIVVPGARMFVEVDPEGTLPLAEGSSTRFPEEGSDSLKIVAVPPMQLTLVPVLEAAEPDTTVLAWVRGISADSPQLALLRHAFPFAEFNPGAHEAYYTSLDLTTEDGQHGLLNELEALRASENGTGYYYGVAASVNGSVRGWGRLPGWVGMGQTSPVTLAHEVGHNLSLRHAPCGGPENVEPAYPYRDGSIGVWGYDFFDGSPMSPERSKDLMTYCRPNVWLSDFYFEQVIDHRAGLARDVARARAAAGPPSDMLVLRGGMVGGELRLDPVFSMRAPPRLPDEPGPYRIRGSGSDGRSLFSLDFAPGEDGNGGSHFFFMIPIEAGWADALERITLTGPEGLVTLNTDDPRRISVVTERSTGRIRALLRDWEGGLPAALGGDPDLDVVTTRGPAEAARLRR